MLVRLTVSGRKLICAVNASESRLARRGCHRGRVLHLRLLLKVLYLLHDHVREAKLDHFLVLSDRRHLEVVVISSEEVLNRLPAERSEVLLEALIINVSPLLVDVLLVEVVLLGRHERCLQLLLLQVFPREVPQPGMVLHLVSPICTEAVLRLPLNHLQNEHRSTSHSQFCANHLLY